ncbi:DNA-directed RNA polymerase subunit beta'' [Nymphaea thermarum]|nr:DNA-directed RNA polymerase subunit beta'' [Nymphaea thermarum]
MTHPSNPAHIMSYSGARGNAYQVHQLVCMRGLMPYPQGRMIDLPIQSNLCEELSLTKYTTSCYEAYNGVVGIVVRTSDAGYLTGRLVEVFQHIVHIRWIVEKSRYLDWACQLIHDLLGVANRYSNSLHLPNCILDLSMISNRCYCGSIHWRTRDSTNIKNFSYKWSIHRWYCGTCTRFGSRHGHPSFLYYLDLYVTIESHDIKNIPPKSFLLIQNDQYVESEQVIVDILAGTSTFHFKERVQNIFILTQREKCIGVPMCTMHLNIHTVMFISYPKQIICGPYRGAVKITSKRINSNFSVNNNRVRHKLCGSDPLKRKGQRISDYAAGFEQVISIGDGDFIYRSFTRKILIYWRRGEDIGEIHANGILRRFNTLTYFDDPSYIISSSGITKYGFIEVYSIVKKECLIEYRRSKESRPKYQMKVDQFFVIPKEVHILYGSSSITVGNNRTRKKKWIRDQRGRSCETVLGKQVNYLGRSIIVIGPSFSLHQCGLSREIAIELFQTFVICGLIRQHLAYNIGIDKVKG